MRIPVSAGILAGREEFPHGEKQKRILKSKQNHFTNHHDPHLQLYDDIWISVERSKISGSSYPAAADEKLGYGPVEGIYQLPSHVKHPYCLILARTCAAGTGAADRPLEQV